MKKEVFTQEFEKCFTVFQQVQLIKKYINDLLEQEISGKVDKTTTFTDPNGNTYNGTTGWVVEEDKLAYEVKIHSSLLQDYNLSVSSNNGLLYNGENVPTITKTMQKVIMKNVTPDYTLQQIYDTANIDNEWFYLDISGDIYGEYLIRFEPHGPTSFGINLVDLKNSSFRTYAHINGSNNISDLNNNNYIAINYLNNALLYKFSTDNIPGETLLPENQIPVSPGIFTAYAPGYSSGCVMFAVYQTEQELHYYITYQTNPGQPVTTEPVIVRTSSEQCFVYNHTGVTLTIKRIL